MSTSPRLSIVALCLGGCVDPPSADRADAAAPRHVRPPTRAVAAARSEDGPSGAISLQGDIPWVTVPTAALDVTASEDASEMCLSLTPTCTGWEKLDETARVELSRSRRRQTVYARFRDADGETSDLASLQVLLDRSGPTGALPTVTAGDGSVTLTWTPYTDVGSGLDNHFVVGAAGQRAPFCSQADPLWEGDRDATTATLTGLAAGEFTVRLCVQDAAGNTTPSRMITVIPTAESDPPEVVSFSLDRGAATTRTRDVFLTSALEDASGVSDLCVSEVDTSAAECRPWIDYDAAVPHQLSGGSEAKTVRAWFRDPHGNISETAEDTIVFDRVPPENGTALATVAGDTISLSWSGFSDALTDVVEYVVVRGDDVAPGSCAEGDPVYRGSDTATDVEDLAALRHAFRVCAVDAAGNISGGDTVRATVVAEAVPPVIETFRLGGGADTVCGRSIDLELSASGASDIVRMCIDEGETCGGWSPYDTTPDLRLSAGAGLKTLRAWVRDADGVESVVPAELDVDLVDCAADLVLSALSVDLGTICGPEDTTLTMSNEGNVDLTIFDVSIDDIDGGGWAAPDLEDLPWTLAPGDARDLVLRGAPGSAELRIETDAAGAEDVRVPLTATLDTPPVASARSLPDGDALGIGETLDFVLAVSDAETEPGGLSVAWTSDVDGTLQDSRATRDGTSTYRWDGVGTTGGTHGLTATVTDACGQTDSVSFGICQDEGYSTDVLDLATWNFEGDALWDAGNGWVQLTEAAGNQVGSAYQTATTVGAGEIDISALIYVSGGSGADGVTVTALDADRMTGFLGGLGGGIGYSGLPGWTVEVDTYYNRGTDPTSEDHVSVHLDGAIASPSAWAVLPDMEDGQWHELRVHAAGSWFSVWIDDVLYIDEEIEGLTDFPAYVGFSAATGGRTNDHLVDSLIVTGSTCD